MDTGIIPRSVYDRHHLLFIPFEFLILPFFYFFVKSYTDKPVKRHEKIVLYSPFVLCVLYLGIKDVTSLNLEFAKSINLVIEYVSIALSVIIILLIFKKLNNYQNASSKRLFNEIKIKTQWLKNILYLGLIIILVWFASVTLLETTTAKGFYIFYPLWISITLIIYWIGYTAFFQKQVYYDRKEIRRKNSQTQIKKINLKAYSKIDTLITDTKLHLNPVLSLQTLSQELNLSEGYISQLINKNANLNFNDYINSLRVSEAKNMLLDNDYENYTILAIGLEAGFNSKSSFYTAFKKFTGKTPIEYKKDVRNL